MWSLFHCEQYEPFTSFPACDSELSFSFTRSGLLAHHRRRHVLACLNQHGQLALADLADEVAARELDEPIAEIPEEDVLRIYSSLWHAHIPKLEDANVVELDQDRDIVSLGANADQLQQLLSIDESGEDAQ